MSGGSGGADTLTLTDTGNGAAQIFTATANTVSRTGMDDSGFGFGDLESLTVQAGLGDDSAVVLSKAAGRTVALQGGGDLDWFFARSSDLRDSGAGETFAEIF